MSRVIILMMDSLGIGNGHDADKFGDKGSDTFGHIVQSNGGLKIPNLHRLGLTKLAQYATGKTIEIGLQEKSNIDIGCITAHMSEMSLAKDTTSGHWEMAGAPVLKKWGYFKPDYPSFPETLINEICEKSGIKGILGNKAASGTEIIKELGEEHIKSCKPICYTSADSCFQIAAHEEYFGLQRLYDVCQIAFEEVKDFAECGLCGTAAVISPVGKIVDHGKDICFPSGMEKMGPVLQKLYDTLTGIQMGRIEAPKDWIRVIEDAVVHSGV